MHCSVLAHLTGRGRYAEAQKLVIEYLDWPLECSNFRQPNHIILVFICTIPCELGKLYIVVDTVVLSFS